MPGKDDVVSLLSRTELFGGLAADDIAACAAAFREVTLSKAKRCSFGASPGSPYLPGCGRACAAFDATEEGRELGFRHATTGDLFGEIAALDGGARTADATALTPVMAFTLDRSALRGLWSTRPTISTRLVTFLCGRLRETTSQMETITLYPMHVRLARFLLIALGNRKPELGKRLPLDLGFSQSELALLLGASRPKVNEALGTLEIQVPSGERRIACSAIRSSSPRSHEQDNG